LALGSAVMAQVAPPALAQVSSSLTIYGLADVALELSDAGRGSFWRVVSGGNLGSRLGFRGSEDLGGGLAAVFRIEAGINHDDGTAAQGGRAWGREASVGLVSREAGTLVAGRVPMPYNIALVAVDAFGWGGSGGQIAIGRNDPALRPLVALGLAARLDNALRYTSPSWNGLNLQAIASLGEGSTSIGRGAGFAARYTQGAVDAVVSTQRVNGAGNLGASGSVQGLVVGGSVQLGASRLFAGLTEERNSCSTGCSGLPRVAGATTARFRLLNLGLRQQLGTAFTGLAQYTRVQDRSDYAVATGDRDAHWLALGGEYTLSKRSMIYGSVGTVGNRNGSNYVLGSGSALQAAGAIGPGNPRATTTQLGVRHSF
jgi:predicted porin